MVTYQDFVKANDVIQFITTSITQHLHSDVYKTAITANKYDRQMNETIYNYVKTIFTSTGGEIVDFTASNNRIASNFFHRLNTQRCTYSLGNGVSFTDHKREVVDENGNSKTIDETKERLGINFDADLKDGAYKALIHGVSFGFWNYDRLYVFPVTEFVPLWDEENGELRAGIRFWQLDTNKPMMVVLYEEDGYTKYASKHGGTELDLEETSPKTGYKQVYNVSQEDGEEVVGYENYSSLPIVPLWGNSLHQSTLVGMQRSIDSFDLIRSGFANDLTDCAQIYWIMENCGGMSDEELARFRDRLKIQHIAVGDTQNSNVTPYTQDIPYGARTAYLTEIRSGLYEDFGGLDVHTVAAGATNDHIDAAYQPMDENADDFEYQIIKFIQQILKLNDIEDTPVFKRNRISNQREQVEMVMLEAEYLDEETILQKLPNISVDEVSNIMARKNAETAERFQPEDQEEDSGIEEEEMNV